MRACVDRAAARCEGSTTGDGRVAQRVSSAAWASAGRPMAGRARRAISRAGRLQRGLGGGEVEVVRMSDSEQQASKQASKHGSSRIRSVTYMQECGCSY